MRTKTNPTSFPGPGIEVNTNPGPGCSKPDQANPRLARILISVLNFLVKCSVYIVCPSVLRCSNLELHQTLEVKNIFKQENVMLQLSFNPGLTLTGFRTTRP